jgi:hypothetical protein
MGYVLSSFVPSDDPVRLEQRADTALVALQAFVAFLRAGRPPAIQDDAGTTVLPAQLFDEAQRRGSGPRLASVLADYADAVRAGELHLARERFAALSNAPYGAVQGQGEPPADVREWRRSTDAGELLRLGELFIRRRSAWHLTGTVWLRDFDVVPPDEVVTELERRHADSDVHNLRRGAEDELARHGGRPPRFQVVPSPDGAYHVWDTRSSRSERRWALPSVARAHAEALNEGRPWAERDVDRELDLESRRLRLRRRDRPHAVPRSSPPPQGRPTPGFRP